MRWAIPIERRFVLLAVVTLWAIAGCAGGTIGALRFENHPAIVRLDDRRPVPRPAKFEPGPLTAGTDSLLSAVPMYVLTVPGPQPARDVNAMDEVPDSSWFENRIGVRELTPEEIARGPGAGRPDRSAPLRVLSAKEGGTVPGLIVEDAAGSKYMLKFDPSWPETETGADVVVQRLLWAAGYHVPDNEVIELSEAELVTAPDATRKDEVGDERPFLPADLAALVAGRPRDESGRMRVLASKLLPGKPLGGYPPSGVRRDDPNDRIPHEHRRSLRAQRLFFAWLGHTDVKVANTLDVWIEEPEDSGRGYVMHYVLDFGKALGVWGRDPRREDDGYAAAFDYGIALRSLLSLGFWRRPWEDVRTPDLRGVGRYEARHFDPELYRPRAPYTPFLYAERQDVFWAARIISRFRREHIAAAVEAGRYSDPRAREYLIESILARRRIAIRHGFEQVAPIDRIAVHEHRGALRLCAVDLALQHRVIGPTWTRYLAQSHDFDGETIGSRQQARGTRTGAFCVPDLALGQDEDGYTMVAIETSRGRERLPDLIVHVARPRGGGPPRVIGIERR